MHNTGTLFIRVICSLSILVASACSNVQSEVGENPRDIVFEVPAHEIVGGIRLAPIENHWDGYGEAIDIRGDVMVVGAPEWNGFGPGSAYVYRFIDRSWQEEAHLIASDREAFTQGSGSYESQRFGNSVALGDEIIAVGAPGNLPPTNTRYGGAVYIYEYDGKTWMETTKLTPSEWGASDVPTGMDWLNTSRMRPRSFGGLVALNGDTLAVGGDSDGIVYMYQRDANGWQEQTPIALPVVKKRYIYTTFMSLFGETLAISAFYLLPQSDQEVLQAGQVRVYVYERRGNSWIESFRFIPDDGKVDYLFNREINVGASVVLGGESGQANLLAIGLPGFPDWTAGLDTGAPEAAPNAPEYPESIRQSGAVYIFEPDENEEWNQTATLKPAGWENPPGPGKFDSGMSSATQTAYLDSAVFPGNIFSENPEISFFGATVDFDGNRLAVTAGFANATYVFERIGGDWVYNYKIIAKGETAVMWEDYAQAVVISGHTLLLGTPGEFGNSAYVFDLCDASRLDCK